jgi:hypothetical protein
VFEISVDPPSLRRPWKAADGRHKLLRWATPSWPIDGSEMFGQFAPRLVRGAFLFRYTNRYTERIAKLRGRYFWIGSSKNNSIMRRMAAVLDNGGFCFRPQAARR